MGKHDVKDTGNQKENKFSFCRKGNKLGLAVMTFLPDTLGREKYSIVMQAKRRKCFKSFSW